MVFGFDTLAGPSDRGVPGRGISDILDVRVERIVVDMNFLWRELDSSVLSALSWLLGWHGVTGQMALIASSSILSPLGLSRAKFFLD